MRHWLRCTPLLALLTGCEPLLAPRAPQAPTVGSIQVSTPTTGLDLAGSFVQVDDATARAMAPNKTSTWTELRPGSHTVRVLGLPGNCTVQGDNPRTVTVREGESTSASFAIVCGAASGVIEIATATTGLDTPPSYAVLFDGALSQHLPPNGFSRLNGVAGGSHAVQLTGVSRNCEAAGGNTRDVSVAVGGPKRDTVHVVFEVTCTVARGVVEITTATAGLDFPAAYSVVVDGTVVRSVAPTGFVRLSDVDVGRHAVGLAGIGANCGVAGGTSRDVNIAVGGMTRDTARLAFDVTCTAATGVIEIAFGAATPDFGNEFQYRIGNDAPRPLTVNATTRFKVDGGQHVVALADVPTNCSVVGSASQTVVVTTGGFTRDTVRVALQVQCTRSEKIAFSRDNLLMVVDTDGYNPAALSAGFDPSWSPDGGRIVFTRYDCDYYYYYYPCLNLGLFVLDRRAGVVPDVQLTTQNDRMPAWKPDGSEIAFVRDSRYIHVMKSDGLDVRLIALPAHTFIVSRPDWSPDGTRFVFACSDDMTGYTDVCVINRNGTGFTWITNTGRSNDQPAWSPDGARIVFVHVDFQDDRGQLLQRNIAIMNADGTGMTVLTPGYSPAWSRDGSRIVFNDPQKGLFMMRTDGSGRIQLTNNSGDNGPAWRP